MFKKAFTDSPSRKSPEVSKIKLENVVNAPQKPTIKRSLRLLSNKILLSANAAINPIIKHPIILTTNVPYGNPTPTTEWIYVERKYLANVPIVPPIKRLIIFPILPPKIKKPLPNW